MNDEYIFILDFPEALNFLKNVIIICDATMREREPGMAIPLKFISGKECAEKMLSLQPVSSRLVRNMLDVIGGYYSATKLYCKEYGGTAEDMEDATKLMKFALYLESKARGIFGAW